MTRTIKYEGFTIRDSIHRKNDALEHRISVTGPGFASRLFFVVSFNRYLKGWYYFATSSNPSEVKANSIRDPSTESETVERAIELTKSTILELIKTRNASRSQILIRNIGMVEDELAGFALDELRE